MASFSLKLGSLKKARNAGGTSRAEGKQTFEVGPRSNRIPAEWRLIYLGQRGIELCSIGAW